MSELGGDLPFERAADLVGPVPTKVRRSIGTRVAIEAKVMRRILSTIDGVDVRDGERALGVPTAPPNDEAHLSTPIGLWILDDRAYAAVARTGSAGLGEGYFRGWWDTDDLVGLLRLFVRRSAGLDAFRSKVHRFTGPLSESLRQLRRANPLRDRKNVRAHYDLSNEFFAAFLDETMTYSSALFETPETPLADASRAKLDRLCTKLGLGPSTNLIEIGTGWGSFAMRAAQEFGANVTTTTISSAQADLARKRFAEAGLTERITLLEEDFRDLDGTFDRLASIEMIEAVDWRDVPSYFASCARLLADDGLMGLQAIVCADQRHDRVKVTDDFITTWVFPGGSLPSIASIAEAVKDDSDLRIVDLEDFGSHYAETLARWRAKLHERWNDLGTLGLNVEMSRLWDFYLAYCQAAFLERHISVVQIVLAKAKWRPEPLALRPR